MREGSGRGRQAAQNARITVYAYAGGQWRREPLAGQSGGFAYTNDLGEYRAALRAGPYVMSAAYPFGVASWSRTSRRAWDIRPRTIRTRWAGDRENADGWKRRGGESGFHAERRRRRTGLAVM